MLNNSSIIFVTVENMIVALKHKDQEDWHKFYSFYRANGIIVWSVDEGKTKTTRTKIKTNDLFTNE